MKITKEYLRANPNHIFVYGDNSLRYGKGGAAALRDEPNTYGFVTKKAPRWDDAAYYKPLEYQAVLAAEMSKLIAFIEINPTKVFLVSPVGAGLANKFNIRPMIVKAMEVLKFYNNVKFLTE